MKPLLVRVLVASALLSACTTTNPLANGGFDLALDLDPTLLDAAGTSDADLAGGPAPDLLGAIDYTTAGPQNVSTEMSSATLAAGNLTLTIYLPGGAGPHPVVVLSPGFQQPRAAYAPYGERLASHGILTVIHDDPGFTVNSVATAARITQLVTTWLAAEHAKASGPLAGKLALDKVGLLGHSRGGQAGLLAATDGLKGKLKGYFGLDPVDTQMGVGAGDRARVALPTIAIPTVFLGETLDGAPIPFSFQACAPAADNYAVLHAAAPSPSLLLTAVGADHYDFEDTSLAFGTTFCHSGPADSGQVLAMAVTLATGFFARELLLAPVGAGLEGAGASGYVQGGRLIRAQK